MTKNPLTVFKTGETTQLSNLNLCKGVRTSPIMLILSFKECRDVYFSSYVLKAVRFLFLPKLKKNKQGKH